MLEMVARSASASEARPSPANSTNAPTTPCLRSIWLMTSTRSVAVLPRGSSPWSRTPTTLGQRLVERLAQQHGLGLDAADAVAQHAQAADHGGVGVGAHERVREGLGLAVHLAQLDDPGQELEVDLVDDARARRHDAQVA